MANEQKAVSPAVAAIVIILAIVIIGLIGWKMITPKTQPMPVGGPGGKMMPPGGPGGPGGMPGGPGGKMMPPGGPGGPGMKGMPGAK